MNEVFTEEMLWELAKTPDGETVIKLLLAQIAQLSHDLGVSRAELEQQRALAQTAHKMIEALITERDTLRRALGYE